MERRIKIAIGIPCFNGFSAETGFDYMRMFFAFGRRYPEYDFYLTGKIKSEQYRARNNIVQAAQIQGADYLLMLDDDQIIDWPNYPGPDSYGFLHKLLEHDKPIVGALYYHRGGRCAPVLMKKIETPMQTEAYVFLRDDEIKGELQEVDVQGGGCMLIKMEVFDKLKPPYFEPEMQTDGESYGTDIQICRKAQVEGFKVYCDTSIVLGHVSGTRTIVTPMNRDMVMSGEAMAKGHLLEYALAEWYKRYREDAEEYCCMSAGEMEMRAEEYGSKTASFKSYEDKKQYYIDLGVDQLCRQVWFHKLVGTQRERMSIFRYFTGISDKRGLDFGCGSAPTGFHLLEKGQKLDFVDIDGAYGYEFLKWRLKKYGYEAGFTIKGPYDFILLMDSLEHIEDWEPLLDDILGRLEPNGALITNFFLNEDYGNYEHVNMDKDAVHAFLLERKIHQVSPFLWIKHDNFMGGASNVRNLKQDS